MSSDRAKRLLEFADAVDADRGFSTGLTHEMRDCAAHIEALEGEVARLNAECCRCGLPTTAVCKAARDAEAEVAKVRAEADQKLTDLSEALRITQILVGPYKDRAEAAEARAERLRVALEFIASGTTGSPDAIVARKALEDDKPIKFKEEANEQ